MRDMVFYRFPYKLRQNRKGSCKVQGESRITSHLHHIATYGIAYHRTSDQAQARPGGQDKGVCHFLKQRKKKEGISAFRVPSPTKS